MRKKAAVSLLDVARNQSVLIYRDRTSLPTFVVCPVTRLRGRGLCIGGVHHRLDLESSASTQTSPYIVHVGRIAFGVGMLMVPVQTPPHLTDPFQVISILTHRSRRHIVTRPGVGHHNAKPSMPTVGQPVTHGSKGGVQSLRTELQL